MPTNKFTNQTKMNYLGIPSSFRFSNIFMEIKSDFIKILVLGICITFVSCFDASKPNYQYMPNMYEPISYETYGDYEGVTTFKDGQEALLPAQGSIARGWQPYDYENTTEGLELAKVELKNPLPVTEKNLTEGEALYKIYCAVCHGDKGDGQGILAQREKFEGVPSYGDAGRTITEGGVCIMCKCTG